MPSPHVLTIWTPSSHCWSVFWVSSHRNSTSPSPILRQRDPRRWKPTLITFWQTSGTEARSHSGHIARRGGGRLFPDQKNDPARDGLRAYQLRARRHERLDALLLRQIERARRETGRQCRILMDLGGPKLRAGEMASGHAVLKWRPKRDAYGEVLRPARVWLSAKTKPLPVSKLMLAFQSRETGWRR